jgi:RNA polymerase sigma-70 factor (sigma-E family)
VGSNPTGPTSIRLFPARTLFAADDNLLAAVCALTGKAEMEVGVDANAAAQFSEFAHSRWPRLVRLAYGITGNHDQAEDLAQTALASAYASWSRVCRADDPDAYLRRIVLNVHRGGFRRRRFTEHLTASPPEDRTIVPDPAGQHGDRAAIVAALAALPRRQREVIVLRYWLDLTETQVAATLGCSVGTVKSHAARAIARLRGSVELADWEAR